MRSLHQWPVFLAFALTLLLTGAARADERAPKDRRPEAESKFVNERYSAEFKQRVNEAIKRGVAWLHGCQLENGSWESGYNKKYPMGPTALALLTLLKGGTPKDDPVVEKAFAYLRTLPMQKTYSVGVLLMALDAKYAPSRDPFAVEEVDRYGRRKRQDPCAEHIDKQDLAWMKRAVKFLIDNQTGQGVWRYPSKQAFDLSNTQYALLGLKAAVRCGIKVPAGVWMSALTFLLNHQEKDGKPVDYKGNEIRGRYRLQWTEKAKARGFRYVEKKHPVTGSMTTAGLAGLIICQSELWSSRRFKGDMRLRTRHGIRDAMAWLQTWFEFRHNPIQPEKDRPGPEPGMIGGPNHYYYLYGLERASMLGRIRYYGDVDWYEDGADLLMIDQTEAGHWPLTEKVVESCFAILFLKRATTRISDPVITPSGGQPAK